jgi:hypothetical protein
MIHAYYACVSFIDAQLGRIFQTLEKLKLTDSTAVVIWGDHGFHLGDHARWAKHTQFEQAMRSPLLARLPGRQKSTGEIRVLSKRNGSKSNLFLQSRIKRLILSGHWVDVFIYRLGTGDEKLSNGFRGIHEVNYTISYYNNLQHLAGAWSNSRSGASQYRIHSGR